MQQDYARPSGVTETLYIEDLVEDALRLNSGMLDRHTIKFVREYSEMKPVLVDRHKVLQILVNLIRNAKHSYDDLRGSGKQIILRITNENDRMKISVADCGIGIPAENLIRIFNHGFTTKKGGHGFGLHSAALTAKELGGTLTASSAGTGQGAKFTLELPIAGKKIPANLASNED